MIAFEVHLNGKKLCTAGLEEFGDLCAQLNWRRGPHVRMETAFEHQFELAELLVAGVNVRYKNKKAPRLKPGFAYAESLEWTRHKFKQGDEIKIRVVEVAAVDKPRKRTAIQSRDDSLRAYKRHIRGVAKYFGWKIQT